MHKLGLARCWHFGGFGTATIRGIPSPHSTRHPNPLGLEGYWCRRAAQSWAVGMKTLWVRRKSLRNVSVGQGQGTGGGFSGQVY